MTVYASNSTHPLQSAPPITKTFDVIVWIELDRVRVDWRVYTLSITGQQGAQAAALTYTIDGKPATMQQALELVAWAKQGGSIEKVNEEVAA